MKAFVSTAFLLMVFVLASVSFWLLIAFTGDPNYYDREDAVALLFFLPIALVVEIFIYKAFYKRWLLVFQNYVISHFAAFFCVVTMTLGIVADVNAEAIAAITFFTWVPIVFVCQQYLLYVENLEKQLQAQKAEIEGFEAKRKQMNDQLNSLRVRLDNHQRWADQHKKGDRLP